jgi:flagellin
LSAKVDASNVTTFRLSGDGTFSVTDTDTIRGTAATVDATTGLTSGGLGIDIAFDPTDNTTAAHLADTGGNKGAFQVGANANQKINIQIGAVDSQHLGTAALDLTTDPDTAITVIDKAIASVSDSRASLGAYQNRFDHTVNNLNVAVENLSASESRIRDTDMAQEMVSYTRAQILTQAGTSMLSQANQSAQNVLSLLR